MSLGAAGASRRQEGGTVAYFHRGRGAGVWCCGLRVILMGGSRVHRGRITKQSNHLVRWTAIESARRWCPSSPTCTRWQAGGTPTCCRSAARWTTTTVPSPSSSPRPRCARGPMATGGIPYGQPRRPGCQDFGEKLPSSIHLWWNVTMKANSSSSRRRLVATTSLAVLGLCYQHSPP